MRSSGRGVPLEAGKRSGTRVVVRLETPDGIRTMQTVGFNRVDPGCEPVALRRA